MRNYGLHARNFLLIAMTVFSGIIPVLMRKVVAQQKIPYTKNPVHLPHPWQSENYAVSNRIHLRIETVCETEICANDKASFRKLYS